MSGSRAAERDLEEIRRLRDRNHELEARVIHLLSCLAESGSMCVAMDRLISGLARQDPGRAGEALAKLLLARARYDDKIMATPKAPVLQVLSYILSKSPYSQERIDIVSVPMLEPGDILLLDDGSFVLVRGMVPPMSTDPKAITRYRQEMA